MYAITSTSFRAINSPADAALGETVVDVIPQSLLDSLLATEAMTTLNRDKIRTQGEQALVDLRAFRDNPAPTNAQSVAVVKLLCKVAIGLIRLQIGKLDADN